MIQSINKTQIRYYQLALAFMAVGIIGVTTYFWKMGFLDGSRAKNLHQASYILESLETKPLFKHIKSLVEKEDYKLAISKMRELEKDFAKIDRHVKTKEYKELKKEFQKLKTSTANLLSFSKTSKVLVVFNTKMDKFYDYVRDNKWRTLSRMSQRVYSFSRSGIGPNRIDTFVRGVNKDFNSMIKITENSVLQPREKSEIISRIKNLQVEVNMLKKYSEELKFFNQLYGDSDQAIKNWLGAVAPALTLQKIEVEQIGKLFVMGLGVLFLVALSLLALGFVLAKVFLKREQAAFEKSMKELIGEKIVGAQATDVLNSSSSEFQNFCENMSQYVNKRMSMGSIFQQSLPLASILLDENLNVIWSNKQFCEDWMIDEEEMKKDYMTWDFLNKLTNIGSDDPVIEALKHGVAGIYQIQVKPNDDLTARPYELFVSPVDVEDKRRIQLFFYDLRSLEQTIKDQAQSLISPIKRSLKLLKTGEFEVSEELRQEFALVGIKDIYKLFEDHHEKLEQDRNSLLDQLELAEAKIEKLESEQNYVQEKLEDNIGLNKEGLNALKTFKESAIGLSQEARDLERALKRGVELVNANINALATSKAKIEQAAAVIKEMGESSPNYELLKGEVKHIKKLSQQLKSDPKLSEIEKKLSHIEISLSKAEMITDSGTNKLGNLTSDYESQQIQLLGTELKSIRRAESLDKIEASEQAIIESLQVIFSGTKSQIRNASDARGHITNS